MPLYLAVLSRCSQGLMQDSGLHIGLDPGPMHLWWMQPPFDNGAPLGSSDLNSSAFRNVSMPCWPSSKLLNPQTLASRVYIQCSGDLKIPMGMWPQTWLLPTIPYQQLKCSSLSSLWYAMFKPIKYHVFHIRIWLCESSIWNITTLIQSLIAFCADTLFWHNQIPFQEWYPSSKWMVLPAL